MWTPLSDTSEEGIEEQPQPEPQALVPSTPTLRPRERVLLAHLYEGLSLKKAAATMGMSLANAKRIAQKPAFKKAVADVDRSIMERVARGEFGAMTIAKAEASAAMERVAQASRDPKLYRGNARVWLAANLEIIKLSGLQPAKPVVVESKERLIDLMTSEEAEEFATTGEWPDRFKDQIMRLSVDVIDKYKRAEAEVVVGEVIQQPPEQVQAEEEED